MISDKVADDANIIWGAVVNEEMKDEISVTVIATGFPADGAKVTKKSADAVAAKAEKTEEEDDNFYDIMSIFNK